MPGYDNAVSQYARNAILTASNIELVVMLYDGALKFLEQARIQLRRGDRAGVGRSIGRAYNVISELKISLDHDAGGDGGRRIAVDLENLYTFMLQHLVEANVSRDEKPIVDVLAMMKTLKEGWDVVAQQN